MNPSLLTSKLSASELSSLDSLPHLVLPSRLQIVDPHLYLTDEETQASISQSHSMIELGFERRKDCLTLSKAILFSMILQGLELDP